EVRGGRAAEEADAAFVGREAFEGFVGGVDVAGDGAAQRGEDGFFDDADHFANGFDVGGRGGGKAGVERVYSGLFERQCDADLVIGLERGTGHLLAVAQGGVAEEDRSRAAVMADDLLLDGSSNAAPEAGE